MIISIAFFQALLGPFYYLSNITCISALKLFILYVLVNQCTTDIPRNVGLCDWLRIEWKTRKILLESLGCIYPVNI